jgi:hypothetical protein
MTTLVDPSAIEMIVGVKRHVREHYGRAVSHPRSRFVYILHSQTCVNTGIDLRECLFSVALDRGIHEGDWDGSLDKPVILAVRQDHLIPAHVRAPAPPLLWEGPECQMCLGTGTARFIHGGGTETFARCPACNGHGRDPS